MTFQKDTLIVWMNGRCVGTLRKHTHGGLTFQYDRAWVSWPHAIPISISIPLQKNMIENTRILPFLDNLLPDNPQIRQQLAHKTIARGYDTFSLLETIGRDCVGALQFLPENHPPTQKNNPITGRILSESELATLLSGLKQQPLGIGEDNEFRLSIAGAQEKTALLFHQNAWQIPHGSTPTTHILKPNIGRLADGTDLSNSVENEYFCMQLTQALGLPTADTEICKFEDIRVLSVKRFDRLWTSADSLLRLPQEDFCQALGCPPTRKYQADGGPGIIDCLRLLQGSDTTTEDRATFFKAILVFWLLAAIDGHAKNFSLSLYSGGRFQMSPLYDIMSIQPYSDAAQIRKNNISFAMSLGTKPHYKLSEISLRHISESAEMGELPQSTLATLIAELKATVPTALEKTITKLPLGFPESLVVSIQRGVLSRLARLA